MSVWKEARAWPHLADMTLGEAASLLHGGGWACACAGPMPVCYCARTTQHANMLVRGAHITVKLIADMAERGAGA